MKQIYEQKKMLLVRKLRQPKDAWQFELEVSILATWMRLKQRKVRNIEKETLPQSLSVRGDERVEILGNSCILFRGVSVKTMTEDNGN